MEDIETTRVVIPKQNRKTTKKAPIKVQDNQAAQVPGTFSKVGPLLTDDDDVLIGKASPINPDQIGLISDDTKAPYMPEAAAGAVNESKAVEPCANAAQVRMTNYKASKMARPETDPPEVAREGTKKEDVTKGECDPESGNPCSSPRQRFMEPPDKLPMPATATNKMILCVLYVLCVLCVQDENEKGEYDKFYGSTAENMIGPMTQIHNITEDEVTFKSLLFDPDNQPPEQFTKHGQAAESIKQYIRRVSVTDDFTDMMPSYHSFVKGVIDSDDPPLNAPRSKRVQGRQHEAPTEDDGVHDDQHQKFTVPIHETTNPMSTACLFQEAVEGYKGDMPMLFDEAYKKVVANTSATDIAVLTYNTATLKSDYSLKDEEEPHKEHDDQDRDNVLKDMTMKEVVFVGGF